MIISKTPLRVSLFGGGTDFPDFYNRFGGGVIGGTIDKYVYTTLLPLSSTAEQNYRIQYRTVESVNSIAEISHPFIREILLKMEVDQKLNIATVSDLPGGTGLGSSSSFAIGLIKALEQNLRKNLSKKEILDMSLEIERQVLNEYGGVQDQYHAVYGGFKHYQYSDKVTTQDNLLDCEQMDVLSKSSILVSTGSTRSASSISKNLDTKLKNRTNDRLLTEMNQITAMAVEEFKKFKSTEDVQNIARLLRESWQLKRSLDENVSNHTVEQIYQNGIQIGAYGGKLLGAGAHGFVYFMIPQDLQKVFRRHFGPRNCVNFNFINHGVTCFEV